MRANQAKATLVETRSKTQIQNEHQQGVIRCDNDILDAGECRPISLSPTRMMDQTLKTTDFDL